MSTIKIGGFDHIKKVEIGGGQPVVIQTMWKDKLLLQDKSGEEDVLRRIEGLAKMGCEILRFALPKIEDADTLGKLCTICSMPLVADIHFDYKIALRILDFPIAKIRINPGNIGKIEKVKTVLQKAKDKNVPIRIGVNAGSLPIDIRNNVKKGKIKTAEALVEAAKREIAIFDQHNFTDYIVSMKASSVPETILCNTQFDLFRRSTNIAVPLHIGVTEAGPLIAGVVRNTAALYNLLCKGIGDTVRVSLSDTMEHEVIAAREILLAVNDYFTAENNERGGAPPSLQTASAARASALEGGGRSFSATPPALRAGYARIVSCPRCGRCSFDTHLWSGKWQNYLYGIKADITVAFMGCPVNGPGEAENADIGITGAGSKVLIFKHGKIKHRINADQAETVFKKELDELVCRT
ncbi:MAG: (E)-4-hydroxy-3-methylbut-2-enyl-diphosphate synthase [Termitinemataceae bacterium]|nr:MAG: (E)-4-hydroxy-3-methylbut-2-enyl-diphosphate synthase [Termitinemataceae bacterium]